MAEKRTFDVGAFLGDQGIKLQGVDEDGQYKVVDKSGQERKLDVRGMLKGMGVDERQVNIEFNTPDNALDESPVGMVDRAKLALGNTKGQIGYLKSKYEDVKVHEDKGVLVKNKGVWQRVDGAGMDPWELTKDVVEGAVSFLPSAAAATVGGAKGAATGFAIGAAAGTPAPIVGNFAGGVIGGTIGGIVGAGAGGAAAEGMRSSLGRLAGTYDSTPEEQLKDIGLEFLFNAGGQTVGLGVKPTLGLLNKGVKQLAAKTGANKLGNASLDVLADVLGRTTGAGPVNTRILFDSPDDVVGALSKSKNGAGSVNDMMLSLRKEQLGDVTRLVEDAPRALSRKFGQLVDDLAVGVDDAAEVDVGGVVKRAQQALVAKGYGKLVAEAVPQMAGKLPSGTRLLGEAGEEVGEKNAKKVFQLLSNNEALKRIVAGQDGKVVDPETMGALKNFIKVVNDMAEAPKATGKESARALMELKRLVNATSDNLAGADAPPTLSAMVDDFRKAIGQEVGGEFHRLGVTDKYVATSNLYTRFGDAVTMARRVAKSENGEEVLLNKLVQGIGANQTYKDFAGDLAELMGDAGKKRLKSISVKEAAKAFAPILPKATLSSLAAPMTAMGATAAGVISPGTAIMAGTQASPRLVMKEVQYMRKALDFVKALPDSQRTQWLTNPDVVRETFKTVLEPAATEEDEIRALLQGEGVVGE